ncbi:MAG: PAS domain S-box protein [Planctomycetota bacterium]|jgi:PAS domain S-box-containing protein
MIDSEKGRRQLVEEIRTLRSRLEIFERNKSTSRQPKNPMEESEEKFRLFYERSPLSYQSLDENGCLIEVNPAWLELLGYSKEEVVGRWFGDFLIPSNKELFKESFPCFKAAGETRGVQFELVRKDGNRIIVEIDGKIGYDEQGNFKQTHCVMRDITERKKTEETLRRRLDFEELITTISTRFISLRPDEIDKGINGALQAIGEFADTDRSYVFQYKDNASKMDNTHEWCREGIEPHIHRLQNLCVDDFYVAREILQKSEVLHVPCLADLPQEALADREEFEAEGIQSLLCVPMVCGESRVGFLGFDSVRTEKTWSQDDITILKMVGETLASALERKRSETALRMSELRIRSLIEQTTDAVFCYEYDPPIATDLPNEEQVQLLYDGVLMECNDVCAKSYGADRVEDVIGRKLTELFGTSPGSLNTLFTDLIKGGYRVVDGEGVEKLEDGTERHYLNNGHGVIEDGKLVRVWGTFRDITERKKLEDRLSAIIHKSPIATAVGRSDGSIITFNEALESLVGYKNSEVSDVDDWANKLYPDDEYREFVRKNIGQALDGRNQDCTEFTITCKDGSTKLVDFHTSFFKDGLVIQMVDITERKKAEESLQESESRFRDLVENIREVFWMENADGTELLYVSPTYEQVWGRSCRNFYENPQIWIDAIHPDDRKRVADAFSQFRNTGIYSEEFRIVRPDGSIRWIWDRGVLIRDESGEILHVGGIAEDITERKKAEEALRESEERFRTLFESAPDAIYITDLEGRFIDGNKTAEELCGYEKEKLTGRNFAETGLLSAEQLPRALANLKKNANGEPTGPDEFVLKKKDGSFLTLEIRTFPVKISDEILVLGIGRDITERKRATETVRKQREELQIILDSVPAGVWYKDAENRLIRVNKAAAMSIGMKPEDIEGREVSEIFPQDADKYYRDDLEVIRTGKPQLGIIEEMQVPGGERKWVRTDKVPYLDEQGNVSGVIAFVVDITKRKQAEMELRQAKEFIDNAINAQVDTFFSRISGYTDEEISVMKAPDSYYDQDDLEKANESLKELTTTCSVTVELFLITKNGKRVPFEYSVSLIEVTDGENIAISIGRDITERKKAEEALREERDRAQKYLDIAGAMFVLLDREGKVGLVNKKGCEILGYQESEILRHDWFDGFLPERIRDVVREVFCKLMAGEIEPVEYYENPILTKNGQERIIAWHNTVLKDDSGNVIGTLSSGQDITERKRAEEALRKSEERFRRLSEATFEGIAFTEKGVIVDANQAFARIFGYSFEELKGKPVVELVVPEHRKLVAENIRSGYERIYEHKGLHKDSSVIDLEVRGHSVSCQGRKMRLTTIRDITERKKAEAELTRLIAILENTSDMVSTAMPNAQLTYINTAGRKLLGWSDNETITDKCIFDAHPKWASKLIETEGIPEAIRDGLWSGETALLNYDGIEIPVSQVIMSHKSPDGQLQYLSTIIRDITERKKAEEALIEKEVTIRAIIETSRDWIWAIDLDGVHTYVNPAVERILGYLPEELIGRQSLNLMHEEDRKKIAKKLPQWKKQKSGWNSLVIRWRHKDGGYRYLESNAVPILDALGNLRGFRGVDRNITERKEVEKRNLDYQERLKSLASKLSSSEEQERRQIAAYLHDNISQALALGRIEAESLRKSADSAGKKVIDELSERIRTIIENVQSLTFDLSSPTLYKFGLEKAVDELLDDLFGKTEVNYKLSRGKSPIQLDNNLSVLLFRCIRELLVNIVKHARAHKVMVAIRRNGDNIQVTVNDDGIGFDFDRNELSVGRTGGFGLFNIQERISFIGGNFDVQSQPGKGCRLTLIVPIKTEMDLSKEKSNAGEDFNG